MAEQDVINDPDFIASNPEAKRRILATVDPDFAASNREAQDRILRSLSARFQNPPTTLDYLLGGLKQAGQEAIPMAGLIGGGILGAGAGALTTGPLAPLGAPGGAAAGAITGYATGRAINRGIAAIYNALTGEPGQYVSQTPPLSFAQLAQKTIADVLEGAALELGGQMGGRGLTALKNLGVAPVKAALGITAPKPTDIAAREAAARSGIELPAGAASGSPVVSTIEVIPTRFPIGRQRAEEMVQRIQLQSQRAAERIGESLGPEVTMETAGKSIQARMKSISRFQEEAPTELINRALDTIGTTPSGKLALGTSIKEAGQAAQKVRREAASAIYETEVAGRGGDEVLLPNLQRVASDMLAMERRLQGVQSPQMGRMAGLEKTASPPPIDPRSLPDPAIMDLIAAGQNVTKPIPTGSVPIDFIQRYNIPAYGSRTLDEALIIQQKLNAAARNVGNDFERRQIRQLMDAVTTDIKAFAGEGSDLSRAAQYYKDNVAVYFARQAPLRRLLDKDPGAVGDKILSTKSPDLLKQMVTVLPTRQKTEIQRAVLEQMKRRSLDRGTGEVSPSKFLAQLDAFGEENLGIVFGDKIGTVKTLGKTLEANFGRDTSDKLLRDMLNAEPEKIVNALASGKIKSLEDFDTVWNMVAPGTRQEMRSALYTDVLANSFDKTTGRFSPDRWTTSKEKVPQAIWDRIMTENPAAALRDLELTFRRLSQYSKIIAQPSQTATMILGPSQVLGLGGLAASTALGREALGGFTLKLFTLLSPAALGRFVYSKTGQRLLTSQARQSYNPMGGVATGLKVGGAVMNERYDPSVPLQIEP